ncbi:recombinase family protein (plasmid) [Clavibacter michiganensis]|uniref:recombinase family protein n=1 Tax=Clavibacter michiganensis TaxID=28447 RepID=UPI003DA1530C
MPGQLIGYARVSTDAQDVTAQRDALAALGVTPDRIYVDHGLTGTNRNRPALGKALEARWAGDTLVVTKLDRLARSISDARTIADELATKGVALSIGGSIHDPTDPTGRLLFNMLAMFAEFESDLIRARTLEGSAIAKVREKLKGRQPKLSPAQERHLIALHRAGDHSVSELVELFGIGQATVYRALDRYPVTTSTEVTLARIDDELTS